MPIAEDPPLPPIVSAVPAEVRLSVESVKVEDQVRMGMIGLHYLRPITPNWYGGISVYGATQGDRGGFFAWGLSSGYRWRDGPWAAEAGLFVGGGGGSPGWVGGGLMLRPHLAVSHAWGDFSLGAGVSQVRFPSGVVNSTQPFATLSWTSDALFGPAGGAQAPALDRWSSQAMPSELAAIGGRYAMRAGSVRRDGSGGAPSLRYAGVVYRRALSGNVLGAQPYWLLSTAGSLTEAYAGYAELLGGIGLQYAVPAYPALSLRVEGALGSGGAGASVDTGGGLLRKGMLGLSWQAGSQLLLSALVGQTWSRGPFRADELRLEAGWRGWDVVPGQARAIGNAPGALTWAPWSIAAGLTHYRRMARDDASTAGLGVTALRLERELDRNWRLVGQAAIGVSGMAGGYASGHLGLGWLTTRQADSPWRLGAEASLGAAGGGGVRVDGGLIAQAQLQARYALSDSWALQADAGRSRSRSGGLSSPLLGLSAVYSFSRLQGKP